MHIPPEESLIEYPSDFPIKVMGKHHPDFAQTLTEVVLRFDPGFDAATVEMRPSKGGNYMGLTFTVRAKHNTGHCRHLRAVQQCIGGFAAVFVDASHVWESIKGAGWRSAVQSDFVQT